MVSLGLSEGLKRMGGDVEGMKNGSNRKLFKVLRLSVIIFLIFIILSYAGIYILHNLFDFTSSNAVFYFVKGSDGRIKVTRDLDFDMADNLLFMVDMSGVISKFLEMTAAAKSESMLDVTWDENSGKGEVKDIRPDGTIFSVTFSRFRESDGNTYGLFIGGELPYGDFHRDKEGGTSGIGYMKDKRWYHIWCAANEGFILKDSVFLPKDWIYLGSKVLKMANSEVLIESRHRFPIRNKKLFMKRVFYMKSGWDYVILSITFANRGDKPLSYTYGYGDEPWLGISSYSRGDIGWTRDRIFQHEGYLTPWPKGYAGYWDRGNDAVKEGRGFTNIANFIQWLSITPSEVYFANDFKSVDETRPLSSLDNRLINIAWADQSLQPGESRTYTLAIGMAKPSSSGFPVKPRVELE